ncbi:MAG TPA: RHS repeat protein, partial [Pirellulaceae bacterium]|nr:RHS repeat protein [Pirellulaceae bacterium]
MLSQLADSEANGGANLQFTAGNAASGFVTIDPELVISASISDGTGRTVITGLLDPSTTPNPLITWSCQSYDHVVSIGTFGSVEETRSIDATGNVSRSRSDGAGRTLQSVDEANQVTQYVYDPQSNVVQTRDPNNVGFDAVYDGLGRQTSSTDTQNDTTASG